MKIVESIGLSRSGHHALMNWIILNLCGTQIEWKYKMTNIVNTSIFLLDEANHDIPLSFKFIDEFLKKIKFLIVCYEDTFWDYTLFNENRIYKGPYSLNFKSDYEMDSIGRFTIIRDFYDTLNSRIQANERNLGKVWTTNQTFYFETGKVFIDRWKNIAKSCIENKISYIKFEDWKSEKKERQNFLREVFDTKEIYGVENITGTQSSFENNKRESLIPNETLEIINNDQELKFLMKELGYKF